MACCLLLRSRVAVARRWCCTAPRDCRELHIRWPGTRVNTLGHRHPPQCRELDSQSVGSHRCCPFLLEPGKEAGLLCQLSRQLTPASAVLGFSSVSWFMRGPVKLGEVLDLFFPCCGACRYSTVGFSESSVRGGALVFKRYEIGLGRDAVAQGLLGLFYHLP